MRRRDKNTPAHWHLAEFTRNLRRSLLLSALVLSTAGCFRDRPYYAEYYNGEPYGYYQGYPGILSEESAGIYRASCCSTYADYPTYAEHSSVGVSNGVAIGGHGSGGSSHSSGPASGLRSIFGGGGHSVHGSSSHGSSSHGSSKGTSSGWR